MFHLYRKRLLIYCLGVGFIFLAAPLGAMEWVKEKIGWNTPTEQPKPADNSDDFEAIEKDELSRSMLESQMKGSAVRTWRCSSDLTENFVPCREEVNFFEARAPIALAGVNNLVERPDNKHPVRIAACVSGGGFRAMIDTSGFLESAERTGLTDAILCFSALSGGTWGSTP